MKAASLPQARQHRRAAPVVSHFEFWPDWAFYAPIVAQWVWLGLRYGSFSLPTAANPTIELGGLCGESKSAILDQVRGPARATLAPYIRLPPGADLAAALRAMAAAGLGWPVIAKPDIGCNGTGVRLLADPAALAGYLGAFPAEAAVLLQRFVAEEGEAGLFYIRAPGAAAGRITSFTLKSAPVVLGDGRRTLAALLRADPRAGRIAPLYLRQLGARAATVPAAGARVRLVMVGNHCKGAIFRDGAAHITPALTAAVEAIARALPGFHFGRLDVRFASLAALRQGQGFTVIEINGVGSEATHVWDARMRLRKAWADQFFHYRAAFLIGRAQRARGHRPAGIGAMWRNWRRQKRLMARYPAHD